ncbi:MAG: YbcC family protein [Nitriliruptoraceae bacterium]
MTISTTHDETTTIDLRDASSTLERLERACRRIAPLWPLDRFVAVNPYLGLADRSFDEAAALLASTSGSPMTLPTAFYLECIDQGRILREDLEAALAAGPAAAASVEDLLAQVRDEQDAEPAEVPTVADAARQVTGTDWPRLLTERVAAWAAAYFDEGQASWRASHHREAPFAAWRREASIDRTADVLGLARFRAVVRGLPDDPAEASLWAVDRLGLHDEALELYAQRLLRRVGGWSAHTARLVWERELVGEDDATARGFLAVLLCWEAALLTCLDAEVATAWEQARTELRSLGSRPPLADGLSRRLVLQHAFDRAAQRHLVDRLSTVPVTGLDPERRPSAQAVFCIDVRSEVLRRHLEAADEEVETLGFAGFFGVPIEYVPLGHEAGGPQCPVLLAPGHTIVETLGDPASTDRATERRRLSHHVRRAWKSFKMGAISCFSFVGPVGLAYLPKLFTDARGWTRPVPAPRTEGLDREEAGRLGPSLTPGTVGGRTVGIPLEDRVTLAEGALRGMSLTEGLARLVLLSGHGATTVNNPYDSGLACGACGGHTGEANARVAAAILNDPVVRERLAARGITIPTDTWFLAGQHDTTTDEVLLYDRAQVPSSHAEDLARLERSLAAAGRATRAERAGRLALNTRADVDAAIVRRSRDWAQVRPEWGLAGCRALIIAPRHRTRGRDLSGQTFLHSYDWQQDEDHAVLELLMTAPMVVASWITLQYYASTVDNERFGSGNKTLHNVVGRLGVLEGNAGDLRVGLPWQSVHDGERYQHEPLRLTVVIEAPLEAMDGVLSRHPEVRALCDNGWLTLLAMDTEGRISHRYAGGLTWTPWEETPPQPLAAAG